jgi:hypothetical protein
MVQCSGRWQGGWQLMYLEVGGANEVGVTPLVSSMAAAVR